MDSLTFFFRTLTPPGPREKRTQNPTFHIISRFNFVFQKPTQTHIIIHVLFSRVGFGDDKPASHTSMIGLKKIRVEEWLFEHTTEKRVEFECPSNTARVEGHSMPPSLLHIHISLLFFPLMMHSCLSWQAGWSDRDMPLLSAISHHCTREASQCWFRAQFMIDSMQAQRDRRWICAWWMLLFAAANVHSEREYGLIEMIWLESSES